MQQKHPGSAPVSLSIGDIYYVLFRRKWLIAGIILSGFVAAIIFQFTRKPVYKSEAKLFIRYLQENKSPNPIGESSNIKSLNDQSDSIINSELEILTSLDIAEKVAAKVGPEKVMGREGLAVNPYSAAVFIKRGMEVEAPRRSSVIRVAFRHGDSKVVQEVLKQIVDTYLEKHLEIHRKAGAFDEFLRSEIDQLKGEVARTEDRLSKAKSDAGIVSLDESKKAIAIRLAEAARELQVAEFTLTERRAMVAALTNGQPASSNAVLVTAFPAIDPEIKSEYDGVIARLDAFIKQKGDLETRFTPESSLIKEATDQIARTIKHKKKLEKEHPRLLVKAAGTSTNPLPSAPDFEMENTKTVLLQVKVIQLREQLEKLQAEAVKFAKDEAEITQLQRKRDEDDAHYRYYLSSLDASRIAESLGAGKVSNISSIQVPSPAFIDGVPTIKMTVGIAVAGIFVAIGLAFFTEFFLDRSVRRPIELEKRLNIPLLLSIPARKPKGHNGKPSKNDKASSTLALPEANGAKSSAAVVNHVIQPTEGQIALRPFFDGLRDRVVSYFQIRNLTHNPKLIALTGCASGAGVSTLAAGLAASLSETGDGNVLLVDMNVENGAAQHFHNGRAVWDLAEFLESKDRNQAQVQENLYLVRERGNGSKLPRILPKRFSALLPQLKASDYDYIIFDMPPVNQISITPRLTSFMDMVLFVVESEKTDRDAVQRAYQMLTESKPNVTAVLNKTRAYVPRMLHQELPGDLE